MAAQRPKQSLPALANAFRILKKHYRLKLDFSGSAFYGLQEFNESRMVFKAALQELEDLLAWI